MNRKAIFLISFACAVGLFALALGIWALQPAPPAIRFVETKDVDGSGNVAVFRITNPSNCYFSYLAHGPGEPQLFYQVNPSDPPRMGMQSGCFAYPATFHEIAPHGAVEFHAAPPPDFSSSPFAVGLRFFRGNARFNSPGTGYISDFQIWVRNILDPDGPDLTWSTLAPSIAAVPASQAKPSILPASWPGFPAALPSSPNEKTAGSGTAP